MKTLEMTGKTVEDAVRNALIELNVTEDKIQVEILQEGSKGLFNFIGSKPAKILVKVGRDYINDAKVFLEGVLASMKIEADIDIVEEKDVIKINLNGSDMGILIGYRGDTLDSLQYLVSLVINKGHEREYKRVLLDTENYRQKREETLKRLADKVSFRVKRSGRYVKLEPMNPYERRIIHFALQDNPYVDTYSEGEEPYRRVVVDLKSK